MPDRVYIACDLKSFYVSVECIERGLAPLTDFWRVGRGYAKKLEGQGLFPMAISPAVP